MHFFATHYELLKIVAVTAVSSVRDIFVPPGKLAHTK
jgi:hypothetical protein